MSAPNSDINRAPSIADHSLILADAAEQGRKDRQLFLFCSDDLPKVDRSKPRFNYTGERLFERRQDVYEAVVKALATPGVSIRSICTGCHVTDDTVRAVAAREKIPIAEQKKELADLAMFGARVGFEKAIELMPEMKSAKDAAVAGAVMADKAMLLNGDPTLRIELTAKIDYRSEMQKLNEELEKRFQEMKRAEVIGGTAEIGNAETLKIEVAQLEDA